ncbi:hypothetical protein [Sphingobium vermicomposti]|uniref:Uncharacterized protein n=1 Tax=Sphingobium vermicomposti TaxID=529005 RepID=A0A846MET2_9SPHN|nr:hypothetical protein [Sphingobium vermicomposti]NIJ15066.1 hypothetical protein [Sphingobium vermicomposti]
MDFNSEELRRRRAFEGARDAKAKADARAAQARQKVRAAKARLNATTRSEQWHRMSLGWLDREAGYTGEMASARVYLRTLPIREYVELLSPYADKMPDSTTNIQMEATAVRDNLDVWTKKGDALLLERAKADYAVECASFDEWERDNPDKGGWRGQKSTRAQWLLMLRTADALAVAPPKSANRGEAHDWLRAHGGNLRLAAANRGTTDDMPPALDHPDDTGAPAPSIDAAQDGGEIS